MLGIRDGVEAKMSKIKWEKGQGITYVRAPSLYGAIRYEVFFHSQSIGFVRRIDNGFRGHLYWWVAERLHKSYAARWTATFWLMSMAEEEAPPLGYA
jgi:hypothetical protein